MEKEKTGFEQWFELHNGPTTTEQQLGLAKELHQMATGETRDDISITAICKIISSEDDNGNLVSWEGVSVKWFLEVFCQTPFVKKLAEFGCELWFVRKVCIIYLLVVESTTRSPPDQQEYHDTIWSGPLVSHLGRHDDFLRSQTTTATAEVLRIFGCCGLERPLKSKATVFISYTGRSKLSSLIQMILGLDKTLYMWFDAFCVDQFAWTGRNGSDQVKLLRSELTDELAQRIGEVNNTMLLLERWSNVNLTLGQLWVLWEIYNTVKVGANFEVHLPAEEIQEYLACLADGRLEAVESALASIDAHTATASDANDRKAILGRMEKIGFDHVNRCVAAGFRQWLTDIAENHMKNHRVGHCFQSNLGRLLVFQGHEKDGAEILESVFSELQQKYGQDHAESLMAQTNWALGLKKQGKVEAAELLYRDVLHRSRQQLDRHLRVQTMTHFNGSTLNSNGDGVLIGARMITSNNLGRLLHERGRIQEAIQHYGHALGLAETWLGEANITTIDIRKNLAILHRHEGNSLQAESAYQDAADALGRELGERHPRTLQAMQSLAVLYRTQRNPEKARTCFQKVLRAQLQVLGNNHPDVRDTMTSFAGFLMEQGEIKEANVMYLEALDSYNETELGTNQPGALTLVNNWGVQLLAKGQFENGERMLRIAYHGRKLHFGEDHAYTIASLDSLKSLQVMRLLQKRLAESR